MKTLRIISTDSRIQTEIRALCQNNEKINKSEVLECLNKVGKTNFYYATLYDNSTIIDKQEFLFDNSLKSLTKVINVERKGTKYKSLDTIKGKFLTSDNVYKWIDCVLYMDKDFNLYVRESSDFWSKFTKVEK